MFEQVLGGFERTRVRVCDENEERTERRKRKKEKNERTGSVSFYIDAWTGSVQTRSNILCYEPLDLGFRVSRSIQRL